MAVQTWITLANAYQYSSTSEGVELKESTVATDISPGGKTPGEGFTVPAGFLNPGSVLRFTALGWYGTTAKPELEIGFYYGAVTSGKALCAAKIESAETVTEVPFRFEAVTRILPFAVTPAAEAYKAAKAVSHGIIYGMGASAAAKGGLKEVIPTVFVPLTKPQTEVAIDLTTANLITLGAKWVTSNALNKIKCDHFYVEVLN